MLDFARTLTLPSAAAYVVWRLRRGTRPIRLMLRSGARFELRPDSAGNGDYGVAYEVFVHGFCRLPAGVDGSRIRLVVDLGANVGLSVLYWLRSLPQCQVIALEPHPRHAAQAIHNIALKGLQGRVEFHQVAAGADARRMMLSDEGTASTLTDAAERGLPVAVVDIFALLSGRRVDLLKLDMEGGEYELLEDPRFAALAPPALVMEWHSKGKERDDRRWCEERLQALGYTIETLFATPTHGMFWALRLPAPAA